MLNQVLSGSESMPPLVGGYISIRKNGHEFYIASVPSCVVTDRYNVSASQNHEEFVDEVGNQYQIDINSSMAGLDWQLVVQAGVSEKIEMEYQQNDY